MIFNNEKIKIENVEAIYINKNNLQDIYIRIIFEDEKSITFNFNKKKFDPRKLEINNKINLIKYLCWDTELITNETYYLFDISKDIVNLIRLDDNLFEKEVHIENPDMIYSPLGENATFINLIINTQFSFSYK